jgi:predicted MFS family arabinose efflux permease
MANSAYRWVVLAVYVLAGIMSQVIWITFSPIVGLVEETYGVGEDAVGYLSAVFPMTYIVLSIPSGYFVDRYGFRRAVLLGTLFLGIFGLLRAFSSTFTLLLIMQTLAGVGQPFVMNSISKLVKSWFPEDEVALATGIGTLSLEVGIVLGLSITPYLASGLGIVNMLLTYGTLALVVLILFYVLGKESGGGQGYQSRVSPRELLMVLRDRNVLLLSILFFLGVGLYTAVITWVEPMLSAVGVDPGATGVMGGVFTLGGIMGSVVLPALSDMYRTRKGVMIPALASSAPLWSIPLLVHGLLPLGAVLFVTGFLFLSLAPLALDLSASSVGIRYAGAANATLWEFSQVGALLLIFAYSSIGVNYGWGSLFPVSSALVLAMLMLSLALGDVPRA